MIDPSRSSRAGVTLRHWTADSLTFVGGSVRPSRESSAVELADSRVLRLIASRLSRLKSPPIGLTA